LNGAMCTVSHILLLKTPQIIHIYTMARCFLIISYIIEKHRAIVRIAVIQNAF